MTKFIKERKVITLNKPLRNENGSIDYADVLPYILQKTPTDSVEYEFVLGLTSYAVKKKYLTNSQVDYADKIIKKYYEEEK